jgi:beta-glucosidase
LRRWVVEPGTFTVVVGASSRDPRLSGAVVLAAEPVVLPVDADSAAKDWLAHPVLGPRLREVLAGTGHGRMIDDPQVGELMSAIPLRRLARFPGSPFTEQWLETTATEVAGG